MEFTNLKGGKELQEFLSTLAPKLEQNIMRGALRAGAKVIAEEAKNNVPVKSGDLRDSIRVGTRAKRGQVTASVKAGNKKAYYYRFVEFGTAAHEIKPKDAKSLFFAGLFSDLINNPGAKPKPYLRPAFDSKSHEAIEAVGRMISKRLTKEGINQSGGLEVGDE